ncbi:hypothetical protein XENOCAPTIV_008591 [Xenoophorus captivus]|uniref:Uncharacterized protein n=1 Tax=Xenoophorus captivus TaxID=1517983 RepID=A0ABV0Q4N4_9TELE
MKSLNSPQDCRQIERVDTDLEIRKLQVDLERVMLENSRLLERSTVSEVGAEELKQQTTLIKKLRPLISETRQDEAEVVKDAKQKRQKGEESVVCYLFTRSCLDDVEKNNNLPVIRAPVPRPPSAPPVPSCSGRPCPAVGGPTGPPLPDSLREDCWYNGPWPSQSCLAEALVGSETGAIMLPPPPLNQASLDDSSRSFPSPPKPTDAMFWEGHSNASNLSSSLGNFTPMSPPNAEWAKPY